MKKFTIPEDQETFDLFQPLVDAITVGAMAARDLRANGDFDHFREAVSVVVAASDALKEVFGATSAYYNGAARMHEGDVASFEAHMSSAETGFKGASDRADEMVNRMVVMDELTYDAFLAAVERLRRRNKGMDERLTSASERSGAKNPLTVLTAGAALFVEKTRRLSGHIRLTTASMVRGIAAKLTEHKVAASVLLNDIKNGLDESYGELRQKVAELKSETTLAARVKAASLLDSVISMAKGVGNVAHAAAAISVASAKAAVKEGGNTLQKAGDAIDTAGEMAGDAVAVVRQEFSSQLRQASERAAQTLEERYAIRYRDALIVALDTGNIKPLERQLKVFGDVNVGVPGEDGKTMLDVALERGGSALVEPIIKLLEESGCKRRANVGMKAA